MDIEKLNKLKPRNRNSQTTARKNLANKKNKFLLSIQPSDKNNNLEKLNSKLNSNFIQKINLNQTADNNNTENNTEISQIESLTFKEDEVDNNVQDIEDDDDDDDDDEDDGLNLLKNRPKNYAQIDNDTKLKLEALLANAGIESITSDLFKDPQIMQTLTTTYVRTLNEVVAKTKLKKKFKPKNEISKTTSTSNTKSINEVVESTFEEFILAAAAVAAASSSSNSTSSNLPEDDDDDEDEDDEDEDDDEEEEEELTEADLEHHNYMIQKMDKKSTSSSSSSSTSSSSSSSSSLKQTINSCIGNLTSPESLLNKLIDLKPDLINSDKDALEALTQVANKKLAVGKSLTELLEENADSVLGLACASGYIELVSVLLAINSNSNLDNVSKSKIKSESTPLIEACSNGHEQIVDLLLKHGANPNKKSSSGSTPLHYAIQNNHANIVRKLLETCKDIIVIDQPNENGHTPLMEASSNGNLECVKILVECGLANVNTYSAEFKETALTLASYKGHVDVVRYLLEKGADCEHKTDEMHTALMEACMDGHVEVAKILIENGASVNMPPDAFESPLTLAACGGHVELADLLIDNHADLEERNDEGYTPLMEAAREGHEEMVALLLFHDADINAITDETQETALTLACCGGCYEVAKFLLEAGADPNLGNASTPLMEAAQEGHLELVQLLIKAGANVNKFYTALITNGQNSNQNITSCESALSLACENGHTDVVAALIKAGAESDRPDPDKGYTPLMKAARSGQLCTVQYLVNNCSVDLNKTSKNNESTALSFACANGHMQVIEFLLQNGANPLHVLKDNTTCLIEASKNGHVKIVELLIDWNYSLNGDNLDETKKVKKKNLKINLKPKSNDSSSNLVKQIKKSVSKLDTTSDLGLENLVNVLHHFAFGETPTESKNLKKKRNNHNANQNHIHKQEDISLVSIEEFCECKCQGKCTESSSTTSTDADKLLHLSLSIGNSKLEQEQQECSDGAASEYETEDEQEEPEDEDEQIKKKENLLQELLKIEKQLEVQRKTKQKAQNSNYDHISMINKYLIKKCQYDLNKLYKIKLKQLQEQKINEAKPDKIAKKCSHASKKSSSNSSTPKSSTSEDWLPPPPPPFAAAAAYLIQQSMKSKANQQNSPHIDLDLATETNNDTALTVAVHGGHEDLVKLLIEKGAHIEHRDKKGYTPLILAASVGHHKIVQLLLLYGADVEAQSDRNKDTALCVAAQNGKYECCEILLNKGQANKEHRNISDYTPLSLAASNGYVNIIKLLLSHGAEINSRTGSKLGISPLMLAAMNGHTQAVKFLIEAGSDVNSQIETNRNTALTLACFQGRTDVVSLLLDKKANIEHRAKTGLTPLMEAASGGYDQVGRILLERGADENAPPVPTTKDTALTIAAEKGHVKFVELLIQYGAQLEAKNKKGCTALWLACNAGHFDCVYCLVSNNADPDSCDSRRTSCLMAAFKKGHVKICKFLVRYVKHFAPDQELTRYISSLIQTGDKDLIKKCQDCMDVIVRAKEKQAQEANKYASLLLKELDQEKSREQNKKLAAQRKREKRKMKKKQMLKSETDEINDNDLDENDNNEPNEVDQKQEQQEEDEQEQEEIKIEQIENKPEQIVESTPEPEIPVPIKNPIESTIQTKPQNKKKKKKSSSNNQIPKSTNSKLADLDDFEVHKPSKLNDLDQFDSPGSDFKQRIIIPSASFERVVGPCTKTMTNLQVIELLTKCTLKKEEFKSKSGGIDHRSVLILGTSLDQTKYAYELIETLINDPLVNLSNLLPNPEPVVNEQFQNVNHIKHKQISKPVQRPKNTPLVQPSVNIKPRNFAEAVAKPVNWNRRHSVSPPKQEKKIDKPIQIVSPTITKQETTIKIDDNFKHPGAPPSAPLPVKVEFALNQEDQLYEPLNSNKLINDALSNILTTNFSQINKPLSSPSLNLSEPVQIKSTKPIGYERQEKQFKNSTSNLDQSHHQQINQPNGWMNNSLDLLSILNQQMVLNQLTVPQTINQSQFNQIHATNLYSNFQKPGTPVQSFGAFNTGLINYNPSNNNYVNFPMFQPPLIQPGQIMGPLPIQQNIQFGQQQNLIDNFMLGNKSTGFNFNNF
ncbi:unnamed protein product [Brachionus calyciflorus]|uniref:Uncharacterized protein n=1 Tax=Brachionus calyciflorus TaxID=104777 RepID=A0A813MSQ0_9BILA|nr:unnamed protein product [Brachionus calyciflorus]